MAKLSNKQELFCLEYIKDLNGSGAAQRAGYSLKTAKEIGAENLSKPNIQERIRELNFNRFNEAELQGKDVINEYATIAFSDIRDYLEIAEGGEITAKTFTDMKGASRAIQSVKERRVIRESKDGSEDQIIDSTFEFKLWDKNKALDGLARHHSLFNDKLKVEVSGLESMSEKELEEELEKTMNEAS